MLYGPKIIIYIGQLSEHHGWQMVRWGTGLSCRHFYSSASNSTPDSFTGLQTKVLWVGERQRGSIAQNTLRPWSEMRNEQLRPITMIPLLSYALWSWPLAWTRPEFQLMADGWWVIAGNPQGLVIKEGKICRTAAPWRSTDCWVEARDPKHFLFGYQVTQFCFLLLQLPTGNWLKYQTENSRSKSFISFQLHAVLSNVMKSQAVLLCPTLNVNHSSVQWVQAACASCRLVT